MAAPQTHFWITFVFRGLLAILGIALSPLQLFWVYFWGCLMDFVDHFTSPSYTRDIFMVRIPCFFKGGAIGTVSKGIKLPTCWLHIWPGAIFSAICGFVFFPKSLALVPFFSWYQHIVIDMFQENDGSYPDVPLLYPLLKKRRELHGGYPIKSRKEIIASTILALLALGFETYHFLK